MYIYLFYSWWYNIYTGKNNSCKYSDMKKKVFPLLIMEHIDTLLIKVT